ncbi:hypothetical protein BDY24DRAFT_417308 [Mrakia frigida]|uniref:uncharacterized protein n=1 Tax=Mrakia frigida TaxID=29902 RepID=UPI003FCC0D51
MLHHQPLVLSSPPSSTPSTPPLPGSLIPSPTPPRSDPPSPIHPNKTHYFTTFGAAGETLETEGKERELILGTEEAPEGSSCTRREEESPSARWTSLSKQHDSEPLLHPAPQHHPRLSSFANPLPWEGSPTSSMSTLSRLEESSQSRTGDTSPPSGLDEEQSPKGDAVDDLDLMVRLDEFGGGWDGGADTWRLGVGFGGRREERTGSEADLKLPDSQTYAAHVVSADSSSGEPSPSSPHRPLPSNFPLSFSLPTDLLSPFISTNELSPLPRMSPFPSFENLATPSSPVRQNASPYLRTTSSRTTTTTTTTRTHVRGHSLSMPTSPPQKAVDAPGGDGYERARTKSGFSTGTSRTARAASVRSWHSDEEDDEDEEDSHLRSRRERVASETPVGLDATSQGGTGAGPSRRHASSLRSSPAQTRGELPFQSSSNSLNKSARITSFQTPPSPTRTSAHPGRQTLHRARSSSSSHPGLSAFGFAFPSLFPSQEQEGFDHTATPSPTPAVGGERRRKTTKSAPSSRVNLAAMFKAGGVGHAEDGRGSGGKGGGIFGLVKDGIQALQHHHQQASTASSLSSSGINLSSTTPFASGSHQPSSSSSLLSSHSAISPSRSNSPSPGDSQALTILTRPIYPIAKFATLLCISFFALLALSSVLVGSYGLTAWDEGRLRIAGARERVEGGRRLIERGVERAREVVGEVMSGGVTFEEPAGDGAGVGREERDASGEERRRHEGSGRKRSEKRTTEEAFKQLHETAIAVVRRFLPSSITALLFNTSSSSTRTRKRSAPHSHPSSSKRHGRKTSTDETNPRTAPPSRQSSRRPSFSTPFAPSFNNSGDEREDSWTRRSSNRTPSPSPTRRSSGHSETRYTFSNPGSPSNPTQEPSEKHSSSSSSGKKRGGGGSTNGLPPRPPLGVLIPSIFFTIVIAVCALVGGFIKGWQGRGQKMRR